MEPTPHASPDPASGPGAGSPATLDKSMLPADPMDLFDRWMADVVTAGLPEPTAMVLATVSADQRPRARMVLLKSAGPDGFTFYTNRTSRKASDLAEVPRACLLFPWHALHRQVIIEGDVDPLTTAESEPYFRSRPRGSQLGAWATPAVDGTAVARGTGGPLRRAGATLAGRNAGPGAGFLGRLPAVA